MTSPIDAWKKAVSSGVQEPFVMPLTSRLISAGVQGIEGCTFAYDKQREIPNLTGSCKAQVTCSICNLSEVSTYDFGYLPSEEDLEALRNHNQLEAELIALVEDAILLEVPLDFVHPACIDAFSSRASTDEDTQRPFGNIEDLLKPS